jgi:membrane protein required for colicin V production
MNWVDLVILAIVAFSGLLGLMRGLVREVLGLGAWIGAVVAAVYGFSAAQPIARRYIEDPNIADPVAFGAVFVVVLILLSIVARIVGGVVRGSVLGGLDRTLGLVFGLVRGAVLLFVAYILGGMVVPANSWPPALQQARSLPVVFDGAAWVAGQLPPQYQPRVYPPPAGGSPAAEALLRALPQGRIFGPRQAH